MDAQTTTQPTFLDRTWLNLRSAWRGISDSARLVRGLSLGPSLQDRPVRPDLPDDDAERLRRQMRECLEGRGGEVTARARAADLGQAYLGLDKAGRARFLRILGEEFAVDHAAAREVAEALLHAQNTEALQAAEARMRDVLVAPRLRLLTQFNALPDGVKFLVDLRGELLQHVGSDPAYAALDADLKALLTSWFDVGFLDLRRITWDAPAALLEKLIAYEAVHEIRSWSDLKNRLDSDRRIYAFFHPKMPGEPLIFVQVALQNGIADSVQALLDESAPPGDPRAADTAVFYSISNAQKGLRGISLGSFLIKRVADDLSRELPRLRTFATLSPIPGFRAWLDPLLEAEPDDLLKDDEAKALRKAFGKRPPAAALREALAGPWHEDPAVAEALRKPLMRLCARYLLRESDGGGRPLDSVARFHLSNGASIERLNWLGDTSPKGLQRSAGIMVNYRYILSEIGANHEAFVGQGKIIASRAVRDLLEK